MASSTGEIKNAAARGLPSYGYFFKVTYTPEDTPKDITVQTVLNGVRQAEVLR